MRNYFHLENKQSPFPPGCCTSLYQLRGCSRAPCPPTPERGGMFAQVPDSTREPPLKDIGWIQMTCSCRTGKASKEGRKTKKERKKRCESILSPQLNYKGLYLGFKSSSPLSSFPSRTEPKSSPLRPLQRRGRSRERSLLSVLPHRLSAPERPV